MPRFIVHSSTVCTQTKPHTDMMRYSIGFLLLFGQASFLANNILSGQFVNDFHTDSLQCNSSCTDRLNTSNFWESHLKSRTSKATDAVVNRRVVEHIIMDENIVGEMHLDVRRVNTDSQAPLQINMATDNNTISGYFFNFHDHKPTFKVAVKDKTKVALTGGQLSATYIMDQFHFHVYCTRSEAEDSTLDKSQVPGELHMVFFREAYKSYNKAVHRFQDGLAVVAINLEVGEEESRNHECAKFSSFVDSISRDQYRTVYTTAAVKQLAAPVFKKHAQYDAYRGSLVEPIECKNCVDVFLLKEPITISIKQMTEFRKGPHCVENDWAF